MTPYDIAKKWGFWLRDLKPGETYPYSHIRGHYRVPMFTADALETATLEPTLTFRLTELGTAARELALTFARSDARRASGRNAKR